MTSRPSRLTPSQRGILIALSAAVVATGATLGVVLALTSDDEPVSAATTVRGRLYYGAGIGVLVYVIRTWGGYPDGVAFAVLLMNMAAPTIDHYTQPRVFGHKDSAE